MNYKISINQKNVEKLRVNYSYFKEITLSAGDMEGYHIEVDDNGSIYLFKGNTEVMTIQEGTVLPESEQREIIQAAKEINMDDNQ